MNSPRIPVAVSRFLLAALVLAVPALAPAPAAAETLTCTPIASLPATLPAPGHYCLDQNFSAAFAAPAIQVNANNVVLDCNDHAITNTAGGFAGVHVANRQNVTVRNCAISGFARGIAFFETVAGASRNHRVSGNRVLRSQLAGIQMAGSANVIDDNRVSENQGGSASFTYGILLSSHESGVNSVPNGVANVVRNNVVGQIAPSLFVGVVGIYLLNVDNTAVVGNTVAGLFAPSASTASGIVGSTTSLGNVVERNRILSAIGTPPGGGGGLTYSGTQPDGIRFEADPGTSNRNFCRDNIVGHWASNILNEGATNGCVKFENSEF